ncbi:hypothetical protein [Paraburkholderia rhynchosiae]|uniref:hypothetical protein n=1 Tax=Paraburkholderia rhynchosiae TaxID=487049 RepID=UPI0011AF2552|nr:hypothetical protein [Paraburkholderia rhynchosiae]
MKWPGRTSAGEKPLVVAAAAQTVDILVAQLRGERRQFQLLSEQAFRVARAVVRGKTPELTADVCARRD